jgi:diguanylate cyclase (GGDEF)-like protein
VRSICPTLRHKEGTQSIGRRYRERFATASNLDGQIASGCRFCWGLLRADESKSRGSISHAKRHNTPLTVLVVDVDRFKQVNTKFGHLTGDVVLAEISAILRGSVRGSDVVVRYGGDEFLILLPEATKKDSQVVVNRIHSNLEAWNDQGHLANFRVSLSIGVAEWADGQTINETLDTADREMYTVKPVGQPV